MLKQKFLLQRYQNKTSQNQIIGKMFHIESVCYSQTFHPEWRNFDQNDMRFLNTGEKFIFSILRFRDLRLCLFSISPMPATDSFTSVLYCQDTDSGNLEKILMLKLAKSYQGPLAFYH
jgi:hypothetical protein